MQKKRFITRPLSHAPYESASSRISKFAFLNHFDIRDMDLLLSGSKHGRQWNPERDGPIADIEGGYIPSRDVAQRLVELLDLPDDRVARMFTAHYEFWQAHRQRNRCVRHCLKCDETGFHSPIFDVEYVKKCPIHLLELSDKCSQCDDQSNNRLSVTTLGEPFECASGHVLWPGRSNRTWPRTLTKEQEDILEGMIEFLEATKKLVEHTEACTAAVRHNALDLSPAFSLPLTATVIPKGHKYLECLNVLPIASGKVRLWPAPPKRAKWLSADTIEEIVKHVRGEGLNLSEVAYREIASHLFEQVQLEITAALKKTHPRCVEFTKILPPDTDIAQWVRWCPAVAAKYRWHIHCASEWIGAKNPLKELHIGNF